jgi:hypothetical protein
MMNDDRVIVTMMSSWSRTEIGYIVSRELNGSSSFDGDDTGQRASDIFLFLAEAWSTLPHWFADTHTVQHDASDKFADVRATQSARTALESGRWRRR